MDVKVVYPGGIKVPPMAMRRQMDGCSAMGSLSKRSKLTVGSSRLPQWGCPGHVQLDIGSLDLLMLFLLLFFYLEASGDIVLPKILSGASLACVPSLSSFYVCAFVCV